MRLYRVCFADRLRQRMHLGGCNRKSPVADGCGSRFGSLTNNSRGTIDGKINSRLKYAGGDHRHDGDHGFGEHGTVAHHAGFGLATDQLGCGAA